MGVATVVHRVSQLAFLVALMRILDPEDFGKIGMAVAFLAILGPLAGIGMTPALIHSREARERTAFHAFSVTALVGLVSCVVVALLAFPVAHLFREPEVGPLLRWMSVVLLLDGLANVPSALLEKDLSFGRVSLSTILSEFVYMGTALGLAYAGMGVWSLVCGHVARGVARVVLSWTLCSGWVWLLFQRLDWALLRDLLSYGLQTVGSSFLAIFNSNWDNLLVGRMLGKTALGFYAKSYDFVNLIKNLNDAMSRVLFPSYTKIRDERERMIRAYLTSVGFVSLATVPAAFGILAIAPVLVPTILNPKWMPMIPAMQVLALMGVVRPLSGTTSPLFLAMGRPYYNIRVSLVHTLLMVVLGISFLPYGIEGVAAAIVAAYSIGLAYNIHQVQQLLPGTSRRILRALAPAAASGLVMALGVILSKAPLIEALGTDHGFTLLTTLILEGGAIYVAMLLLTDRPLLQEALRLAGGLLKGKARTPSY